MLKITLLSILIFLSGISAFVLSNTLKDKSIHESFFFNSLFYFVIAMILCAIFTFKGDINYDAIFNLETDQIISYTTCAVVYIVTALLTAYLYKEYSVMEIAPYKNSLVPLLQFAIGFLIFKNNPTPYKIMGGILMVIGIYIFSL